MLVLMGLPSLMWSISILVWSSKFDFKGSGGLLISETMMSSTLKLNKKIKYYLSDSKLLHVGGNNEKIYSPLYTLRTLLSFI